MGLIQNDGRVALTLDAGGARLHFTATPGQKAGNRDADPACINIKVPMAAQDLALVNQRFYDALWSYSRLVRPERFNTWPLLSELASRSPFRLEVGPGLRPRLPISGTHFVDISPPAIARLKAEGGLATEGAIAALPFADEQFDLACAFDVIEHIDDDRSGFRELSRVLKKGGLLVLSVPIHAALWTDFDVLVGHARRYEPRELVERLGSHHFEIERSAPFGMQPSNPWLVNLGMHWLTHHREKAMRWYNGFIAPMGLLFQRRLRFSPGLIDVNRIAELILVCGRR
jgi:SAM-dependent methyltransferase